MNPAPRSLDPRLTQPTMHVQSNSLLGSPTFHANESAYTLATVQHESDESSSLLSSSSHLSSMSTAYGTTPIHPPHQTRRVIFNATLKMAVIFFVSCIVLGGILWVALPTLDPYVTSVLLLLSLFYIPSPSLDQRRSPATSHTEVFFRPSGSQLPPQEIPRHISLPCCGVLCRHLPLVGTSAPFRSHLLPPPPILILSDSDIFQPPSLLPTWLYVPFHPWRCCMGCCPCIASGLRMCRHRRLTLLLHLRCSRPCSALPSFLPVPA